MYYSRIKHLLMFVKKRDSTCGQSSILTFDTDLPYLTDGQRKAAENKLNKPAYLTLLVNDFKRFGVTDYEDVINNALVYKLFNQLACQYSWKAKGNKAFMNEFKQLYKGILILFSVLARFTKADLTNKMYGEIVAKWLVQVLPRFKREETKNEKARRMLLLDEEVIGVKNLRIC